MDLDPVRGHWDWYWQHLALDDLRGHLFESLAHLHAQPPLHNLVGGLLARAFGDRQLDALQGLYLMLGAAIAAMVAILIRRWAAPTRGATIGAAILALNPALFIYEAYPLYAVPTAFLITFAVWALATAGGKSGPRRLLAAVAAVGALVLLRSLYHLVLMAPILALAWRHAGNRRRLVLGVGIALSLPGLAWYGGNLARHGFFGASSWGGMSLWRLVTADRPPDELDTLAREGVVEPMVVERHAFARPSRYAPYGFTATSDIPSLGRDDYNNINVPAISRRYGAAARALMRRDPGRYVANAGRAALRFTVPSTRYVQVEYQRARLGRAEALGDIVQGRGAARRLLGVDCGPLFLLGVPVALVALLARGRWPGGAVEPSRLAAAGFILWAWGASSLVEYRENERFRFDIEPIAWAALVAAAVGRRAPGPSEPLHAAAGDDGV